jgi:hypothetical protein
MSEIGEEEQRLRNFEYEFTKGLADLLELLELRPEQPLAPDPFSMGFDERTLEELNPDELGIVRRSLFYNLGIDTNKLEKFLVRQYSTPAPEDAKVPGEIKVDVYRTNKEVDGIFLQELTFTDDEKRWVIGPDVDI